MVKYSFFLNKQIIKRINLLYYYLLNMTEFFKFVTENLVTSQLIRIAQNYVSTMTELIVNTYDELELPATPLQSAKFGLTNQDITVLLTACCSLFGLIVAFFTVFSLLKCIYWMCLGSNLTRRGMLCLVI